MCHFIVCQATKRARRKVTKTNMSDKMQQPASTRGFQLKTRIRRVSAGQKIKVKDDKVRQE